MSDRKQLHPVLSSLTSTHLRNQLSTLNWPIQGKPNNATWTYWAKAIWQSFFEISFNLKNPLAKLTHPQPMDYTL
eukprot:7197144-Ditylum_brightwellii.AAC.1